MTEETGAGHATGTDPSRDHAALSDTFASRRYFAKFGAITQHLTRVAGVMDAEGRLSAREVGILTRHVSAISYTFRALSMKYLLAGRDTGQFFGSLQIDTVESGFPVFNELLVMANDAQQAQRHLAGMKDAQALKERMVRQIVGERELPTRLQFALSQRLYYEELVKGDLFWARNDPQALWLSGEGERRRYLLHWAVYDSQINLPTIYLMEVEDTGRTALPKDERRWPEVQAQLMGQSMGALKLVTIATAFDRYFNDLHPKRLRRFHIGPMYSHAYTRQTGPLREVLAEAGGPVGQDWALAWTIEELESERVEAEKVGWFTTAEREVFALDPFSGRGVDTGATRTERAIILPERPYQVLAEKNPAGFSNVRKFVVSPAGRVLSY
ncbi:hypothetical protein SAMN05216196_104172 [Lutimaribacter pacificus]|uniref:Uncharacterized protein n=1 Tax=Lutimaribacter pacificus TaxID=391948 RepID=A0A1H0HZY3_9RHOB|nr:hypothetical protein [Lutimaribacter pacificus]SDO24669.1 hypothetical protein SAMN05216196_104172 [Lutimaribacter pacificus]SHK28957.1 hypothetical protein SAMN05444142_104213 [Lutimaribacter pacificus]